MWPFLPRKDKVTAAAHAVLNRSLLERRRYSTTVLGKLFVVYPGVFSPKYFYNTVRLFASRWPLRRGDEVLEVGCGSGVVAICAVYRGASRALAIDISRTAVRNTRANIALHHMESRIEARESDVFSGLKPGETFDAILWNLPFGTLPPGSKLTVPEMALYDPAYAALERFVHGLHRFLKPGGRVYVGFSTSMGDFRRLRQICKGEGRKPRLVFSQVRGGVKFEILELIPSGHDID